MPCSLYCSLQAGDWANAVTLMRWLRALGVSDFGIFPEVGAALCELVNQDLEPIYRALYPRGYRGLAGVFPKVPRCTARLLLWCTVFMPLEHWFCGILGHERDSFQGAML